MVEFEEIGEKICEKKESSEGEKNIIASVGDAVVSRRALDGSKVGQASWALQCSGCV